MNRRRSFAPVLLLAFLVAACSSNSSVRPTLSASLQPPTTGSASPVPPAGGATDCATLASAAEVSAIVGESVAEPTSASANNIPGLQATGCAYVAADGSVAFSFGQGPNEATVQTVFQGSKLAQGGEDVSGLGDSAYYSPTDHNLLVIQGTTFLSVGIILASISDPAQEKGADVALAQKIFPRL
jgi:hypothetical protein